MTHQDDLLAIARAVPPPLVVALEVQSDFGEAILSSDAARLGVMALGGQLVSVRLEDVARLLHPAVGRLDNAHYRMGLCALSELGRVWVCAPDDTIARMFQVRMPSVIDGAQPGAKVSVHQSAAFLLMVARCVAPGREGVLS